ncbi:hypothetical protein V8E36_000656 [Tilletia maclaganii]
MVFGLSSSSKVEEKKEEVLTATQSLLNKVEDGAEKVKSQVKDTFSASSSSSPSASSSDSTNKSFFTTSAKDEKSSSSSSNDDDTLSPSVPSFLSGSRQSKLDAQIQTRIRSELGRLRKQEAEVRAAIDAALEKENVERERKAIDAGDGGVKGRSGVLLRKELEEIRSRLGAVSERSKREIPGEKDIQKAREQVVACYKAHPDRALDCWAEAQAFKQAVSKAERAFVASHSAAPKV